MATKTCWCAFCGKSAREARVLVQSPLGLKPCICGECIDIAGRIHADSVRANEAAPKAAEVATKPTAELVEIDDGLAFIIPAGVVDDAFKADLRAKVLATPGMVEALKAASPYVIQPGKDGGNPRIVKR